MPHLVCMDQYAKKGLQADMNTLVRWRALQVVVGSEPLWVSSAVYIKRFALEDDLV